MWDRAVHPHTIWDQAVHPHTIWDQAVHPHTIWDQAVHPHTIWDRAVHPHTMWEFELGFTTKLRLKCEAVPTLGLPRARKELPTLLPSPRLRAPL
uniref:Uncharacterized protein n=1 Tax=Knipowitschia caucasica TaxID=637954 RepID=A0AAV2MEA8_KNICA